MNRPAISVILPAYNVAGHIGACIASLQAQSLTDFEAIVIEDGSTDDTAAHLAQAIAGDPRFRVIAQDNQGLSVARNVGLEAAQAPLIAFLDGDDRFDPEFLAVMSRALEDSQADWVACGLRNMHPDGSSDTHSTIHTHPDLPETPVEPRLWSLGSWDDVIAHYPSAWNKLYRRTLIDGLRFTPDTWFEDHAFFCQAAARSPALLHVPRPLYWQTRGRAGQITASDSDRVFDQFPVLDQLAALLADPVKPGGATALPRLAHRLIRERSTTLADPDRRQRFLTRARSWFEAQGIDPDPGDNAPAAWRTELLGACPVSIVIPWDGQRDQLQVTLTSLADQTPGAREILIVADNTAISAKGAAQAAASGLAMARGLTNTGIGQGAACNTGLAAARGALIVFADAGDRLTPDTLPRWCRAMLEHKADLGVSQFRVGLAPEDAVHCGLHDTARLPALPTETAPLAPGAELALALHAHPTAKIFRRKMLLDQGMQFGTRALAPWAPVIGAALAAERVLYFPWPGAESGEAPEARRLWRHPVSAARLAQAIDNMANSLPAHLRADLPAHWPRRLYARALAEGAYFTHRTPLQILWFRLCGALALRRRGWHHLGGPVDPYIEPDLLRLLGPEVASRKDNGR